MRWEGKGREDIERELMAVLCEAKLAYEQARTRSIEAAAWAADSDPGSPDGVVACGLLIRQNAVASHAMERYRQALGWFTEFAITGKMPPEDKRS